MSGHPVLQSSFEYHVWKSLDGGVFSKGGPAALAKEVAMYSGTMNSAVLVMLIDALAEQGTADRETLRSVVSKARAVDCLPSVRACEVLLDRKDVDGAEELLAMSAATGEMVFRSLSEARVRMARGDTAGAREAALRAYGYGPGFLQVYPILAETDPQGEWPQRQNIQEIMDGKDPTNPPGSGKVQDLYRVYYDWFSGRRDAATSDLIRSQWYARRDPEFLLASARLSMDERDWHSASMVYGELLGSDPRPFVYVEAAEAAIGMGDASRALDLLSKADIHSRRVLNDIVRARALTGDRAEMMDAVRSMLDSELSGSDDYVATVRFLLSRGLDSEAEALLDRYSRYVGDDSVTLTMRSVMLMRTGDYPSANIAAKRAVRKEKTNNTARAQLARVLYLMNRTEAAERECSSILAVDPGNQDALELMRDLQMSREDYDAVASTCRRILESNPDDLPTRISLAVSVCHGGDRPAACDLFRSVLKDDGSREMCVAVISSMLSCGMDREAAQQCEAAERQYARDPMLKRLRGNAEYSMGDYLKASVAYADAAALDPHNPVLWHSKGMADEARGDFESAEDAYNRALLLDQGEPEYWVSKSVIQERSKDRYGAIESLNRAIELDPHSSCALVRKARILQSAGRFPEALYYVREASKADPEDVRIMDLEASVLAGSGDTDGAVEVLKRRLGSKAEEAPAVWLARLMVSAGDRDGALAVLDYGLKEMPDSSLLRDERDKVSSGKVEQKEEPQPVQAKPKEDVGALTSMSASLMEAGDLKGAMRMIDRAIRVEPRNPELCVRKARIALAMGDYEGAELLASNGLRRNPGHPGLYTVSALSKETKGDLHGALSDIDHAISDGNESAEAYTVKGRILERLGQPAAASSSFAKAAVIDPEDLAIAEDLARQQAASGNLSGAFGTVSRIIRKDPTRTSAILLKAEISRDRDDESGILSAYQQMMACTDVPNETKVRMVRMLEDIGRKDEARALMGGQRQPGYTDAVKRYAEKVLRRAFTTRTSFDDPDIPDALGLDPDVSKEVSRYLSDLPDPGQMGPGNPDFEFMERQSHDVVLKMKWTDLEGQPMLPLEKVFVSGGFRDADSAKALVAYIHKAMFVQPGKDDRLSDMAMGLPKGMTVFEIMRECDLGVYEAAAVKSMIVRSVVAHLGLHELAHQAGGVVALGEREAHGVGVVPELCLQVLHGAEHLAPAALGRALGQPRDDEVLGTELLALGHGPLDLAGLALGEDVLGSVQGDGHEGPPGADLTGDQVDVLRCGDDRFVVVRGAVGGQRDDHVALHRLAQGEAAGHALAEHLVEEDGLVGVDEHHLEVRRQRGDRALPVLTSGQRLGHDALEGHAVRHDPGGLRPVVRIFDGRPELLQGGVLLWRGVRDVRADRALDVAADQPLAHQVRHRSDRPEPLDAEVVGEALGARDRVDIRVHHVPDLGHGHGQVPDGDLERVADEVAELYGAAPGVDAGDLHVLQVHLRQVLRRAAEGHELGGDRALVLGAGEADAGAGHAQAPRQEPHEAVGLPVPAGDGGDGVLAVLLRPGGIGDLPDDEVLREGLEMTSGAIGVAEVHAHPDGCLGGTALAVQGNHSLISEK